MASQVTFESALLERCTFPPSGTAVDCAVSGGADSLALLVLAVAAGCDVTALHVDHGLRDGSGTEVEVVANAAERFGARFVALEVNVQSGPNLEARARAARYEALPDGALTGHTVDDQAETVLINLMRGAGIDGLAGMTSRKRPLLNVRRHETHALCEHLGLVPVQDPSNDEPIIVRNRVRHELIPLLDDIARRDVVPVIARQTAALREEADLLDVLSTELDPQDARAIAAAPDAIARRALREWLRNFLDDECHPPDKAAIDRVLQVAKGDAKACDVVAGIRVTRSAQRLSLNRD